MGFSNFRWMDFMNVTGMDTSGQERTFFCENSA